MRPLTANTLGGSSPEQVINMAVPVANLIGRGLYGADLKQVEDRVYLTR